MCVERQNSIRGNSSGTRPGLWLKKRPGPPLLWQTSAFALRPSEISNLYLTHGKGQAHPRLPTGVEPEHFLAGPPAPEKSSENPSCSNKKQQICFPHTASTAH